MSCNPVVDTPRHDVSRQTGEVVPFHICSGIRPVTVGWTVFPHGGTYDEVEICPARDICTWYAAHDLGGTFEMIDEPTARLMAVLFKTGTHFSCANFSDHETFLREQRRAKQAAKAKPDRAHPQRRPASATAAGTA